MVELGLKSLRGSPPLFGKWLKQHQIDLVVVLREPETSSAWWRTATETDRQGAEVTTLEAARSVASSAQCRRTARALCIFD